MLGIVRGHKGLLTVETKPTSGTIFSVFFPAVERAVSAAPTTLQMAKGEGIILVVDDEDVVRRVAARALQYQGFREQTATNGVEALEIYSASPHELDVVSCWI